MKINSQKAISTTRAPRVQIEYDVEVNGENQLVELPFVIGVISDLGGNDLEDRAPLQHRNFVDIDGRNFNQRLKEISPSIKLQVDNKITNEGLLQCSLNFNELDDFRPDRIAQQIPALLTLLDAREKLATLLTYMDGKSGAESLLQNLLKNVDLMKALSVEGVDATSSNTKNDSLSQPEGK